MPSLNQSVPHPRSYHSCHGANTNSWVFTTWSPGPGICMEGGKEKEIRLSTNRNVWGRKGPEVVGRKNKISSWRISPTNSTLLIDFVKCQLHRCLCSLFLFFRQSPCLKTWHSYKRVGFWFPDFVKFWIQVPSCLIYSVSVAGTFYDTVCW